METSKNIFEEKKRVAKAKQVFLNWKLTIHRVINNDSYFWNSYYNVMDGKKVKYHVKITSDGIYDSCSCPSFYFGMKYPKPQDQTVPFGSLYFSEHGHTFQCKHIIAAIQKKEKMNQ